MHEPARSASKGLHRSPCWRCGPVQQCQDRRQWSRHYLPSLLDRLSRRPDDADWRRLVSLYTPVLHACLGRHGLQPADLDDLMQEVLGVVAQEMQAFRHNGRVGAFRTWLRAITAHCMRRFWRAKRYQAAAPGGSDFEGFLTRAQAGRPRESAERRMGPRTQPRPAGPAAGAGRAGVSAEHLAGVPSAGAGGAGRRGGGGGTRPQRQRRPDRQVAGAAADTRGSDRSDRLNRSAIQEIPIVAERIGRLV